MKKTMITVLVIAALVLGLSAFEAALAGVPGKINYQGKLTNPDGELITEEYDISFTLFTAIGGGEAIWTETHPGVQIWNGLFNVMLGSTTPLSEVFQANDALYLEIAVDAETLAPRQEVVGVGYAIRTSGINVGPTGNVGIGTAAPEAALHVEGEVLSQFAGLEYFMVPQKSVIMWSGTLASVPDGWQLCDGTNGTPDLRNRFVYGTAAAEEPGATGGTATHTHSFSDTISSATSATGGHSHTYSQIPSHSHAVSPFSGTLAATGDHSHSMNPGNVNTTGAGNHNHGVNNVNSSFGTMSGRLGAVGSSGDFNYGIASSRSHTHTIDLGAANSTSTGAHTHTATVSLAVTSAGSASVSTSAVADHSHTLSNYTAAGTTGSASTLPPYFKLAYIMAL